MKCRQKGLCTLEDPFLKDNWPLPSSLPFALLLLEGDEVEVGWMISGHENKGFPLSE